MSKVLTLTNSFDNSHFNAVAAHLRALNHKVTRLNVDAVLRGDQSITWDYQVNSVELTTDDQRIDLLEVDSVWFRKPFGFGTRHGFAEFIKDPVQRTMVEKEVRDIIDGLSSVLGSKPWVNHPKHLYQARLKPYQLHLARAMGLHVPDSIITNNPEEARSFCGRGATVFKALASQELDYGDVLYSVDTTLITDELIERLDFIRSQPILLQQCIDKSAELRVTCIGDEIFVAKQTLLETADIIDWRPLQDTDNSTYEPWTIQPETATKIQSLMKALNLSFAAMDFAIDRDGRLWFLEVNPNGQWLGYTDEIGMPAAAAMARLLAP